MDHTDAPAGRETVLIGTVVTKLIGSDPTRRSMLISPPVAGRLWFFPEDGLSVGDGFSLNWDDSPFRLCCCDVGRLITSPWFGIIEAGDGPQTADWNESSSSDNGAISLDHAAVADRRHRLELILASFDAAPGIKLLEIQIAAATVLEFQINNRAQLELAHPPEAGVNVAIGADLAASGTAGQVGHLSLHGVTINAGDGGANVGVIASTIDPHGKFHRS